MKIAQLMTPHPVTVRPSSMTVADAVTGAVLMCGPDGEAQTVLATLVATCEAALTEVSEPKTDTDGSNGRAA